MATFSEVVIAQNDAIIRLLVAIYKTPISDETLLAKSIDLAMSCSKSWLSPFDKIIPISEETKSNVGYMPKKQTKKI